ncbi:hypothetical protein P0Y67_22465 [Photobacterium sp. SP02]|uniref:hypothetical protein n=1 Tax=Photobacterium sp. SP02 TaxID=3032280 RepID=UPI0031450C38
MIIGQEFSSGYKVSKVCSRPDTKSEWQQSVLLEPSGDGSGHFIHGVFEGMPSDGDFSLYIASPCDPNSGEYVFLNKTYQEIIEPKKIEPITFASEIDEEQYEAETLLENKKVELLTMWKKEALGIEL